MGRGFRRVRVEWFYLGKKVMRIGIKGKVVLLDIGVEGNFYCFFFVYLYSLIFL